VGQTEKTLSMSKCLPLCPRTRTLLDPVGMSQRCQTRKSPTETAFLRWGSHVFKKRLGADIVGQRKTERWTSQGSSALPWENAECKQKRSTTVTARYACQDCWFTTIASAGCVPELCCSPMPAALETMRSSARADWRHWGFAALVADLYGNGASARDIAHAWELMGGLQSDETRWRGRAQAALDALSSQENVDSARLAAVGFCFGGSTALELARSGAPLVGVVSFHGGLHSKQPEHARNIKAKVLVCHGAMDPLVPRARAFPV
jgi:hypothetical protein